MKMILLPYFPPSADELKFCGGSAELKFGTNSTKLKLPKAEVPSGGALVATYDVLEDFFLRDLQVIQGGSTP